MWIYLIEKLDGDTWYLVGHYDPNGRFKPESDHKDADSAAMRVNYLNGGSGLLPTCA